MGKKVHFKIRSYLESLVWTPESKNKMTCLKQYLWRWLIVHLVTIFHKAELAPSLWLGTACRLSPHERSVVTGCQLGNPFPGPPMKISQASSADFCYCWGNTTEGGHTKKTNPYSFPLQENFLLVQWDFSFLWTPKILFVHIIYIWQLYSVLWQLSYCHIVLLPNYLVCILSRAQTFIHKLHYKLQ